MPLKKKETSLIDDVAQIEKAAFQLQEKAKAFLGNARQLNQNQRLFLQIQNILLTQRYKWRLSIDNTGTIIANGNNRERVFTIKENQIIVSSPNDDLLETTFMKIGRLAVPQQKHVNKKVLQATAEGLLPKESARSILEEAIRFR